MIRIFYEGNLQPSLSVILPERQSHYLKNVMRCKEGEEISIFNHNAEYVAVIETFLKKSCNLLLKNKVRSAEAIPKLVLACAPIKQDFSRVVMQATELGVTDIIPIITERTIVRSINKEKLFWSAIEATEQCERMRPPLIHNPMFLEAFLAEKNWQGKILFCNERADIKPYKALPLTGENHCILIGPEGGFTSNEITLISNHPDAIIISLGKRILKASTAIIASLSMYHALYSGWK